MDLLHVLGALLVAGGAFTLLVAGIALVEVFDSVRVRRTTIGNPLVGHALIRARVEATWGAITAPLSRFAVVDHRTSIAMTPEDDSSFERKDLVAGAAAGAVVCACRRVLDAARHPAMGCGVTHRGSATSSISSTPVRSAAATRAKARTAIRRHRPPRP